MGRPVSERDEGRVPAVDGDCLALSGFKEAVVAATGSVWIVSFGYASCSDDGMKATY
jgi:hypothetical protein